MSELFSNLAIGWNAAITPTALVYCFIGVFFGTLVGVLPGVGALAAISLLLPITFHLEPSLAIIMLAGVYYGTAYGGSTAAILLNLPGVPSAAIACLDGYPMSKLGRGGIALFLTTIASFIGAMSGLLLLALFATTISRIGLNFGPAEYFSMMVLGLVAASSIATGSALKGTAMMVLGLILGLVGMDISSGTPRFNFGTLALMDGLSLVALAMGLFGVSEIISSMGQSHGGHAKHKYDLRSMIPTRKDWREALPAMFRGSGFGAFFGALPGVGGSVASFLSYGVEKRISSHPETFGHGAVEGLSAAEAANNAAVQTAFVPSLTLGIPGDAVMALMLGALIMHGVFPGPTLISSQPSLFWGLVVSFAIGNIFLLILNIPLIGIWIKLLQIPYHMLYPAIIIFIAIGAFSVGNSAADIYMVVFFGLVGYLMIILGFHPAPLLLGFVLGPMIEENFRRAMQMSRGDLMTFVERPISFGFMFVTALIILWSVYTYFRAGRRARHRPTTESF